MADNRDFFHLNRLKGFNDALFPIVATILILPIRKLEVDTKDTSLEDLMEEKWVNVVVYFIAFLVICSVWESHVNRFRILSHADDILVWLNLTSLLFVCFLPFTCNLAGTFYKKYTPIILICVDLLILEFLEIIIIFYSFSNAELLTHQILELPEEQQREQRNYMLLKKTVNPVLFILAASLSLVNKEVAWILLGIVIISPCLHRLLGVIFRSVMNIRMGRADFDRMFGNQIDTERVECFSDGAFAIVATLLVLDITADEFPTKEEVAKDGIERCLLNMWRQFLTFGGTYIVVALLWFVHHSLFHYIKNMNQVMLVFNNISLAFMGLTPLVSAVINTYGRHSDSNETLAVQFSTVAIFGASVAQGLVFVVALIKGATHFASEASPRMSPRSHNYLAVKMCVLPLVSCVVYFTSFSNPYATYVVYHSAILATPILFIILKVCFGRGSSNMTMDIPISAQSDLGQWEPRSSGPRPRASRAKQAVAM
ncbi:hypothetical protein QZH41_006673 [Actinostola sp. cb2023]|nr:hypothetical protein QZH41_006673 [Actinostola sp. cb2023]